MTKNISIGDLHRSNNILCWKTIDFSLYDKVIFLGDYVDGKNKDVAAENLLDILNLKLSDPEKFILLIGNHDTQYFIPNSTKTTDFDVFYKDLYEEIFTNHQQFFQLAFQIDNHLWTHAGITIGWYKYSAKFQKNQKQDETVADFLNRLLSQEDPCLFDVSFCRGGYSKVGGPLWADKVEILHKPLAGYHQIVGHSQIENIKTYTNFPENTSVTMCDCLWNHADFYELEII
jgi:hypothetical protein